MKREIKFRGIEKPTKTFVYGYLCIDLTNETYIESVDDDVKRINTHWLIQGTEGQFTGLKDKNGKEIYEGDILSNTNNQKKIVEFIDGCFILSSVNKKRFIEFSRGLLNNKKVIGNIHENPELLSTPTAVL